MERTQNCDPSLALLSLMAEYHDLASRDLAAGRDRPARTRIIEDLLVPKRTKKRDGVHRLPVRLELHRPAQIATERSATLGATFAVTLDSFEIALTLGSRRRLKLRSSVTVSIQTGWPKLWWSFIGCITRIGDHGRTVKVRLLRSLGCRSASSQPSEPRSARLREDRGGASTSAGFALALRAVEQAR